MGKKRRPPSQPEPPPPAATGSLPPPAPDALGLTPGPGPGQVWRPGALRGPKVRLDFDSTAEDALLIATVIGGFGAVALVVAGTMVLLGGKADAADRGLFLGGWLQLLVVIAPLAWLRWQLDETYVLDNEGRAFERWSALAGVVRRDPVARFDQVFCVAVAGTYHTAKHGSWWTYAPMLMLRDGQRVQLGPGFRNQHAMAAESARALASHLGVAFEAGAPEGTVVVAATRADGPPEIEWVPRGEVEGCLPVLVLLAAIFLTVGSGPILAAILGALTGSPPGR